ncbi:MAG: hypothetical protein RRA92_08050 [Gemmatimonadota bacterium]|nr:hypothetical protein [Gemmatimonadota bacterium]
MNAVELLLLLGFASVWMPALHELYRRRGNTSRNDMAERYRLVGSMMLAIGMPVVAFLDRIPVRLAVAIVFAAFAAWAYCDRKADTIGTSPDEP